MDSIYEDEAVKQSERMAALRQKETESVQTVMQSSGGRYLVYQILNHAGVYRSCFGSDSNVMAWREGKRDLGLWVLSLVTQHCPDLYSLMTEENKDEC